MSTWYLIPKDDDLMHYGVKGMKWRNKKGSMYQPSQKTNASSTSSSKSGRVSKNDNSINNLKGQLARLLRTGKITDKQINNTARDWYKLSKAERSILLNSFRSNNPKLYRKLITAIAKYNNKKTSSSSKGPKNSRVSTKTITERTPQTRINVPRSDMDHVGRSTGLTGVAIRAIENKTNTSRHRGGGGGRF